MTLSIDEINASLKPDEIPPENLGEVLSVVRDLNIEACKTSFWHFCKILAPDFYKEDRWHLKVYCDTLQKLYERKLLNERGEPYENLIIEMPPRHGKSRTLTLFNAWILGLDNKNKVITASYNDDLAQSFSRNTRDIISEPKNNPLDITYSDIFDAKIKKGNASYQEWAIEGQFFSYKGTGIGGSVTGKGGNCLPAGTIVLTDSGKKDIALVKDGERVLSFNHERNKTEWKRIVATAERVASGLVEIADADGNRLSCTDNHRIFISGRGYVEAKDANIGDEIKTLEGIKASDSKMYSLRKGVQEGVGRVYKASKARAVGLLLRKRMLRKTYVVQVFKTLSGLRETIAEKAYEILLRRLPSISRAKEGGSSILRSKCMPCVWERIPNEIPEVSNVFDGMQREDAFTENGRSRELELSKRGHKISARFQEYTEGNFLREEERLRRMWIGESVDIAPQGREYAQQYAGESCDSLQTLPYCSSQIKAKSFRECDGVKVYDIQVDGNNNFFANNILVHNCLIMDDLVKDAYTAYNENELDKIWAWYTGTFVSRAENAIKILSMTPWCKSDPGARLQKLQPGKWYLLSLPAYKDGNMLCPEILSYEQYKELKEIGDQKIITANYDLERIDAEGSLYGELKTYDRLPDNQIGYIGYVDTADEGKDYLCAILGQQDKDFIYVTDVLYTQSPQDQTEPELVSMIELNGTRHCMIESNNGGRAFARNVERILRERGNSCAIEWFHQSENKNSRILTNAPIVKNNLLMPKNWEHKWPDFYVAMIGFQREGKNKHDDAPDAATGTIEKFLSRQTAFDDDIIAVLKARRDRV